MFKYAKNAVQFTISVYVIIISMRGLALMANDTRVAVTERYFTKK